MFGPYLAGRQYIHFRQLLLCNGILPGAKFTLRPPSFALLLSALLHGSRAVGTSQTCGVEHRAPPIFGRATITLGIGPHSSCCSVAEYYCAVWARLSYTNLIDTQLHSSVRLISGCLQPVQLSSLPVLSNVAPPSLRHKAATDNMLQIIEARPNWPV